MIKPEDNPKVIMAGLAVIATLVGICSPAANAVEVTPSPGVATTYTVAPSASPLFITAKKKAPTVEEVADSTAKKLSINEYGSKDALTAEELKLLLYSVGFRGSHLKEAWCIAMRESTGRPMAHNTNASTGDNSYGLFQINMIGSLGGDRKDRYDLKSYNDLFDPLKNAQIAFQMSNGGNDWSSWKGMNAGARQWLEEYPK